MTGSRNNNYLKQLTSFYWENGYTPELLQLERLAAFAELVVDKNESINLISRKDIESVIENHIFISSFITKFIPERCTHFLDIGTGGGFPGIPVSIMRPEMRGVLVDSIKKKMDAVGEFINKLKINNVKAECARVEDGEFIGKYENTFDLIVSRATVPLIVILRYAFPLIKDKAVLLAIKGGDLTDEMSKAQMKYASYIKKSTVYELHYKPTNMKNEKGKKVVMLELTK